MQHCDGQQRRGHTAVSVASLPRRGAGVRAHQLTPARGRALLSLSFASNPSAGHAAAATSTQPNLVAALVPDDDKEAAVVGRHARLDECAHARIHLLLHRARQFLPLPSLSLSPAQHVKLLVRGTKKKDRKKDSRPRRLQFPNGNDAQTAAYGGACRGRRGPGRR